MSSNQLTICPLSGDLKVKLDKFKMRKDKNTAAIVMKINVESEEIEIEEEFEDISLDDLQEEIPAHRPTFIAYSYVLKHEDGRVSYPCCLIFVSPVGGKLELNVKYSGSFKNLVKESKITKVFEVRSVEEITEDWLKGKLSFFR